MDISVWYGHSSVLKEGRSAQPVFIIGHYFEVAANIYQMHAVENFYMNLPDLNSWHSDILYSTVPVLVT